MAKTEKLNTVLNHSRQVNVVNNIYVREIHVLTPATPSSSPTRSSKIYLKKIRRRQIDVTIDFILEDGSRATFISSIRDVKEIVKKIRQKPHNDKSLLLFSRYIKNSTHSRFGLGQPPQPVSGETVRYFLLSNAIVNIDNHWYNLYSDKQIIPKAIANKEKKMPESLPGSGQHLNKNKVNKQDIISRLTAIERPSDHLIADYAERVSLVADFMDEKNSMAEFYRGNDRELFNDFQKLNFEEKQVVLQTLERKVTRPSSF